MNERRSSKFIRVNETFHLVGSDEHSSYAKRLNVLDEINKLRETTPEALDAGMQRYEAETSTRTFYDFSGSLELPHGEDARIETVNLWKASHPEEKVIGKHSILETILIETD